jgi:hypothetical protein
MADMSAIVGLTTSMRAAAEIVKAMVNIRDENLIQSKVFELTREIISAQAFALDTQAAQADLLRRVRELEEEKAKLEAWATEKGRYEPKTIQTGVMVYVLKSGMDGNEQGHYFCPTCYSRGKAFILQRETQSPGHVVVQICHNCGTELIEHGVRTMDLPKRRR